MSYCGPFPADYRDEMRRKWMRKIKDLLLPHSKEFTFISFMTTQDQTTAWQEEGLPTDNFSNENGVFITEGLRWALNIDPQSQAINWLKNKYGKLKDAQGKDLMKIADPKDKGYLKVIKNGIIDGAIVLLQDIVGETLDPTLDNVLNKSIKEIGGGTGGRSKSNKFVLFGTEEIPYNDTFKLFMTTRQPNPHYTPEVSTKVAVINFTVVEDGLED